MPPTLRDISWPLAAGLLTYPGNPPFTRTRVARVEQDGYALEALSLSSHTGTHLDAPAHFVPGGPGVDLIPPAALCGQALVLDARPAGKRIGADFLRRARLGEAERLLLRTLNEDLLPATWAEDHAALTAEGAAFLRAESRVRLVGIDYLSIEAGGAPDYPVHRALLAQEPPIYVLECLDLRGVTPGRHELWCLPLRLPGCDGSPARAVLRGPLDPGGGR
ncbi:MAG TPA: cyclase family protein [Myxococcota bacterium]|nr:cyclase family protein [Myxococcota bacterium]HRY95582.1 cyclase family protein [Myxococcota bacterium]